MATREFDGLLPAEDIDRVLFLQIADQSEILLQDFEAASRALRGMR
jgi:hypothetical protein